MNCPICQERFDLGDRLPFQLNCDCKKPLCNSCARDMYMYNSGKMICSLCNKTDSRINSLRDLQESSGVIAKLQEERRLSRVDCSFHPGQEAERLCSVHLLPLCRACGCLENCKLEPLHPSPLLVQHLLREGVRRVVDALGGEDFLRADLGAKYVDIFDPQKTVQELLELYRSLPRDQPHCSICLDGRVEALGLIDMELYCVTCKDRLIDMPIMSLGQVSCGDVVMYIRQQLPSISFWHLDKTQLNWLRSQQNDLLTSLQIAKTILSLKKCENLKPNEVFFCPSCLYMFDSTAYCLLQLPCSERIHALCQDCAIRPICPLDWRDWTGYTLPPIQYFTPCAGDVAGPIRTPRPLPKRVGEKHELYNRGILIPDFDNHRERLHVWKRYLRVLPENPLQYRKESFEEPWYVNQESAQVEALTFRCFRRVWLRGISLANPLEPGKVVYVNSAILYTGNTAQGNGDPYKCANTELQGGDSVLTDIYFQKGKLLQPQEAYTLKIKLLGANPAERIAIYHGNHIGRIEEGESSDGTAWSCERTVRVGMGEKNSGQHEIASPVLRLIYSD